MIRLDIGAEGEKNGTFPFQMERACLITLRLRDEIVL